MKENHQSERAMDLARRILLRVRRPEGIFLTALEYVPEQLRTIGTFCCPRSRQFPNPELDEVTGGQLMDVISQSAYVTAGLLLRDGVEIFGVDFDTFLDMIHRHRVNYVKSSASFMRPCKAERDFRIEATLDRYPDGSTTEIKHDRSGRRALGLVKMRFEARQPRSEGTEPRTLLTAEIVACCRFA